jgi:SET domain-containing protein
MKAKLFQNQLVVKKSAIHGYGVFAKKDIKKGEIVEDCYAIACADQKNDLSNFLFTSDGDDSLMLTGYGCIYNHSAQANTDYIFDAENKIIVFKARQWIKKGEELLIDYGKNWFTGRNVKLKKVSLVRRVFRNNIFKMCIKGMLVYYTFMMLLKVIP